MARMVVPIRRERTCRGRACDVAKRVTTSVRQPPLCPECPQFIMFLIIRPFKLFRSLTRVTRPPTSCMLHVPRFQQGRSRHPDRSIALLPLHRVARWALSTALLQAASTIRVSCAFLQPPSAQLSRETTRAQLWRPRVLAAGSQGGCSPHS
jgi:hypothetical protein